VTNHISHQAPTQALLKAQGNSRKEERLTGDQQEVRGILKLGLKKREAVWPLLPCSIAKTKQEMVNSFVAEKKARRMPGAG
jgi:hypothetical protein